ncbi:MAG: nitronate monooxygenase [Lentisphaeria bacterium]|nr:nitronate monooxygenase [Lentisphaeria bacterium]
MKLPSLKIRNLEIKYPVIQAGMGVSIGSAELAAAVVKLGGMGTIASVGLGDPERGKTHFVEVCSGELANVIRRARSLSDNKPNLGVNIMVALSNYREIVETSVQEKVDYIISGAGLPLLLPEYVGDADIALIPVISSGRAYEVVVKTWLRKYARKPDAVIIEGPLCGGHLGFTPEMLAHPETCSMDILLKEVKEVMARYGLDHPVLAAEGVTGKEDIERFLKMGYDGVQVGTHFITTEEAGIDAKSKQVLIDASNEDIVVIKSPVGLPVRVLKTPLVKRVLEGGKEKFTCPYRCLRSCNPAKSLFCIARALLATKNGDVEHGLYMVGCRVDDVKKIYPVKEFFDALEGE